MFETLIGDRLSLRSFERGEFPGPHSVSIVSQCPVTRLTKHHVTLSEPEMVELALGLISELDSDSVRQLADHCQHVLSTRTPRKGVVA